METYPSCKLCGIFSSKKEKGDWWRVQRNIFRELIREKSSRGSSEARYGQNSCTVYVSLKKCRRHIWNSDAQIVSLNQEKCGPGEFQRRNIVRHPCRCKPPSFPPPPRVLQEKGEVESACVYDWITFVLVGYRSFSNAYIFNPLYLVWCPHERYTRYKRLEKNKTFKITFLYK